MSKTKANDIIIHRYKGSLELIQLLEELIFPKYSDLFHAVIVHGSVAVNEVIKYSDFDGFLIVNDRFWDSKRLRKFEYDSMKLIYQFDPIQHHGWFKIRRNQLNNFPQSYLPIEALHNSALIFPFSNSITLTYTIETETDYGRSLDRLINSIKLEMSLNPDIRQMNIYELKSLLSKIMLLPSMYYSFKHRKGVYKKHSFQLVRDDFSMLDWHCIEVSSTIRKKWDYKLNFFAKKLLIYPNHYNRKIAKRIFYPKLGIPEISALDRKFLEYQVLGKRFF